MNTKFISLLLSLMALYGSHATASASVHHDVLGNQCSPDLSFLDMGYRAMFCDVNLGMYVALHQDEFDDDKPNFHLIDKNGKHLLPEYKNRIVHADYTYAHHTMPTHIIFTLDDGKMGVLSTTGLVLPPIYDEIEDEPFVHIGRDLLYFRLHKGNKVGFANHTGQVVIPLIYDDFGYIENGLIPAKKDNKWGVIDDNHRTITPFVFDLPISTPSDDTIIIGSQPYGYANTDGKIVIAPTYQEAHPFYDNKAIVKNSDGKWGVINKNNQAVIPFMYDGMTRGQMSYDGKTTHYVIKMGEKYGLLSANGTQTLPAIYDEIDGDILIHNFLKVKQNGKYGLFDDTGKQLTPIIYDEFYVHHDNRHLIDAMIDDEVQDSYRLSLERIR